MKPIRNDRLEPSETRKEWLEAIVVAVPAIVTVALLAFGALLLAFW